MNKKIILYTLVMLAIIAPLAVSAATGIVPDCGGGPCGINDLFKTAPGVFAEGDGLVARVIDFILFIIIIPISIISIAVAGFKLIIQGDKDKARSEAKDILLAVFIGLFVAFAAWLIIKVILTTLVNDKNFSPPVTYSTQIYEG